VEPVQELYAIYDPLLAEGWNWLTIYYLFGEGRSRHFAEYGLTQDRSVVEIELRGRPPAGKTQLLFNEIRTTVAPDPLPQPTHIELTVEHDGKFATVLGYGEPNWDISPRPWPDDITADEYTYKKAWPEGLRESTKQLLDDPRSLIGFD